MSRVIQDHSGKVKEVLHWPRANLAVQCPTLAQVYVMPHSPQHCHLSIVRALHYTPRTDGAAVGFTEELCPFFFLAVPQTIRANFSWTKQANAPSEQGSMQNSV